MAYTSIIFKHPHTGAIKEAPVGFSWTTFFWGFFPALFRSDFKWAIIIFIPAIMTWGLSNLVFCFIYNKFYIKDLIGAGFKAKSIGNGNMKMAEATLEMNIPLLSEATPLQGVI